jgi:hypothetical protein
MKTSVLCSSIFFMADSVFNGLVKNEVTLEYQEEVFEPDDGPVLVHAGSMGNALPGVLGFTGQAEGLWSVEGDRVSHFPRGMRVDTLENSLLRCLGLAGRAGGFFRCKSGLVPCIGNLILKPTLGLGRLGRLCCFCGGHYLDLRG